MVPKRADCNSAGLVECLEVFNIAGRRIAQIAERRRGDLAGPAMLSAFRLVKGRLADVERLIENIAVV